MSKEFIRMRSMLALMLCAWLSPCTFCLAAEAKKVATVEGITEYKLDNGLKVILFPDPSRSTVTVNATYLVGSRHEGIGEKGMAHLLEHMLFKGTPTRANIWGELQDHGADFNGSTWVDRTNYYETLPASQENLEFALGLEADRMINSKIAAEDLKSEMTVVRNEFEIGENDPEEVLSERLLASAYLWHNYGSSTIGNRSDIERVPVESLRRFYKMFYRPDNAVLVVAGKFDPKSTLELIEKDFGSIPKPTEPLRTTYTIEPPQDGDRKVSLRRVGDVAVVGALYHIPSGSHPDTAALDVLDEALTREPSGKLYQALVKSNLAVSLSSSVFSWAEPGVYEIKAKVRADQDPEKVLGKLLETVEGSAKSGFTDEEIERAKSALLADIDVRLRDSTTIGVLLSEFAAIGDWRLLFVIRDRYKMVTKADVERVAGLYLVSTNRTSGVFFPTKAPERTTIPDAPSIADTLALYKGSSDVETGEAFLATPENIEKRTTRTAVEGVRLALLPKKTRGNSVKVEFRLHFGDEKSLVGRDTAQALLPSLLLRGTKKASYTEIRDRLDKIKTKLALSSGGPGLLSGSIETNREHLSAAISMLSEILRSPSFPEAEFGVLKKQRLARFEAGKTDPMMLGMTALRRAMNPAPKGTIHYVPTIDEQIESTRSLTLEDVKALYTNNIGGSHIDAAFVGDFDQSAVLEQLKSGLASWKSPVPYQRVKDPFQPIDPIDSSIETPDKTNAMIALGACFPLKRSDPDFPALDFANFILGGSPKSRLLTTLRHKGGLSYAAGSQFMADELDENAAIVCFAMCAPPNASKAMEAALAEFEKWVEKGVAEEEVKTYRDGYLQAFQAQLGDDEFIASELADGFESGKTILGEAKRIDQVKSLSASSINKAVAKRLEKAPLARLKAGDFSKKSAK